MLIEYGSGSSIKTQILLESMKDLVAYVPVDISRIHLLKTAARLRLKFPKVEILPVVADFTQAFALPTTSIPISQKTIYFPGSTIGNFTPEQASELLALMARTLGPQGGLLIGIDLQKDVEIIEAAYNDASGVTSEFILNILARINRDLGGDFQVTNFAHKAVYNSAAHRIEISIVSRVGQTVEIGDEAFHFDAGEEILAEYSHKYSVDGFSRLAAHNGFRLHQHWTDDEQLFGVLHLVRGEA